MVMKNFNKLTEKIIDITYDKKHYKIKFSFCTLVTNMEQYQKMVNSCLIKGFTHEDTEFLYINNCHKNYFDAYSGIKHFFEVARGEYIILCHQDLVLEFDDRSILEKRLGELTKIDPYWMMAGNAGGGHPKSYSYKITTKNDEALDTKQFPFLARSLDENFIIVSRKWSPTISCDLHGFHLYGTELCQLARISGHKSYVIDFHLKHYGTGKADERFYHEKRALIQKYARALKHVYIQTTCTRLLIISGTLRAKILNNAFFMFIAKEFYKLTNK